MPDSANSKRSGGASWPLPTAVITLLAVFGIAYAPGYQGGSARSGQAGSPPTPSRAGSDAREETPFEALLAGHFDASGGASDATTLHLLQPLARFYAPRLARQGIDGTGPPEAGSLSPGAVVDWMIDPRRTGDDLMTLVTLVPDPARSGTAYRFDSTMTALLLAFRNAGFVLDNYRIGWKGPSGRKVDLATADPPSGRLRLDLDLPEPAGPRIRRPGSLLLRKLDPDDPGGDPGRHELILLLLVPETPVTGVDSAVFQAGLDLADRCERARAAPPGGTGLVRILGPHFSGSASSIVRTLRPWLDARREAGGEAAPPAVRWINGGAISLDIARILEALNPPDSPGRVEIACVIHGSDDMNRALARYLREHVRPRVGNDRIAFVIEETTGYSNSVTQTNVDPWAGFEKFYYSFPLQIAEIRRGYARQGGPGGAARIELRSAERLRYGEDEGNDTPELIRPESPGFSAAGDEMRLLRVAEDINRRNIRLVWLSATDLRDRLFVAEFLRTHCPDVLVVGPMAEPAYTHSDRVGRLRGLLTAGNHPSWIGRDDERPVTLPEFAAHGTYNAALAHLCDDRPGRYEPLLVDYTYETGPGQVGPVLWLAAASQQGQLPLTAYVPADSADPGAEGRRPAKGAYQAVLWRPIEAQPDAMLSLPAWPALAFSAARGGALTSGVSPLLPLLFGLAALVVCWFGYERNRGLRDQHIGGPCTAREVWDAYPLPGVRPDLGGPIGDHLRCMAVEADALARYADPASVRMYRHPRLYWLALASFLVMPAYGGYASNFLSAEGSFLVLFVLIVLAAAGSFGAGLFPKRESRPGRTPGRIWPHIATVLASIAAIWIASGLIRWEFDRLPGGLFARGTFRYAIYVAALTSSGLLVFVATAAAIRWAFRQGRSRPATAGQAGPDPEGVADCDRWIERVPPSVLFGVILGGTLSGFLAFRVTTLEAFEPLGLVLILLLVGFYGAVIHETLHLREYWARLEDLTVSLLSLPMGSAFDRLPRRLTSRPGSFREAFRSDADGELTERFAQLRAALARTIAADPAAAGSPALAVLRADDRGPESARALVDLLGPSWESRGPAEAYPDQADRQPSPEVGPPATRLRAVPAGVVVGESPRTEGGGDGPAANGSHEARLAVVTLIAEPAEARPEDRGRAGPAAETVAQAESYLALEIVRYINRHFDILWIRVAVLSALTVLLMATVNGYPFQPVGTLFRWTMLVVVLVLAVIVRVLVGFNRNEFIARVNKVPADRSLWNLDFLGRMAAYVGPVLALLAALSVGVADLLRLLLGPLLP